MKNIILTILGIYFSISVFGQSKKKQIEALSYKLDSLDQLIVTERSNNAIEVGFLESEISTLQVKIKVEKEQLEKVGKELNAVKEDLNLSKEKILIQKEELENAKGEINDIYNEFRDSKSQYYNLEWIFINALFNEDIEKIQANYEGIASVRNVFFSDLTGDNIDEVILYYVLINKYGGNSSLLTGLVIYQMENNKPKVYGTYHNSKIFVFDKVLNGEIFIDFLQYADSDGNCCPSISVNTKIQIQKSNRLF